MHRTLGAKAMTGIIILMPVAISAFVLVEVANTLGGVVDPIAELLPMETVLGVDVRWAVTVVILFVALALIGWLVETRLGERLNQWFEEAILNRIPGYTLARSLTRGIAGRHAEESFDVALVALFDGGPEALALVVEDGDELCTVFVPQAPTPTLGSIYFVPRDRVKRVNLPATAFVNGIMQWGIGLQDLLEEAHANASVSS